MANSEASGQGHEYEPNFELTHHGAIREDNWAEYEAKGFQPVEDLGLRFVQGFYGVEHVYTGDAYDEKAARPLRHKPGTGIYVSPEGLAVGAEAVRKSRESLRMHGYKLDGD